MPKAWEVLRPFMLSPVVWGSASNRRPLVGLGVFRTCVRFPLPLNLKDEMTLKSRGPIPFYYESLYVV